MKVTTNVDPMTTEAIKPESGLPLPQQGDIITTDKEVEGEVGEANQQQQNHGRLTKTVTLTNGNKETYHGDRPGKTIFNGISKSLKVEDPHGDFIVTNGDSNHSAPKKLQDKTDSTASKAPSLNGSCTRGTEEDYLRTNGDVTESPALCCNGALIHDGGGKEQYSCRRQQDEGEDHLAADWGRTVAGVKEQAFARLQEELNKAHQELRLRDEEVNRLSRVREEVEAELEELTASLFQEAHNMVREANVRQATAERALKESQMKVEVLTAEVAALKTLVLTSTPSRPNPHLHPQIDPQSNRPKDDSTVSGVGLFIRKHRRSPSHFNLKYGRENSPPESPVKEQRPPMPESLDNKEGCEVDPNVHKEFMAWKQCPCVDKSDAFIARVYDEDINLCLNFNNKELGARVQDAIERGNIYIEAVSDKTKTVFPKKCALLEVSRQCHYRMRLGDQEQWYCISQICRNRIIAVCDFLNYLRYNERGLVKSSVHDVYWEMTRLRKEMVLARLGLALSL
ncbi:guanine nucleotide exchange factor for Rab-3A isoform X2 [Cryptotermes secundus]|nr:guanine nucleotide exchange factor for Rab-3A isoform X2 [Cryptotermes secundus]XP_023708398.1 guanine nucleotide exchange factor for Rab-3A isoform X2 [Cryptotermes secundus]